MANEKEADVAENPEDTEDPDNEEDAGSGKSGKRRLLFIALPVLLLIGGVAGAYFTGMLDTVLGGHGEEAEAAAEEHGAEQEVGVYFDLPEMLVNLNTSGRRTSYLRVVVSLELASEADVARVEAVMPRVIDNFQVFLRELRVEDLRGSAGMYRLREELLLRVTAAAKPAEVRDVLFREMLVQ